MQSWFIRLGTSVGLAVCIGASGCSNDERVSRVERAITSAEGDVGGVVHGNNLFALALYDELRKQEPGNVFFSPFSISAAFAMTYAGAKGETAQQMREVLQLQIPDAAHHEAFGALLADLGGPKHRGYELSIANRLFGQTGYSFRDEFLELTANAYGAPIEQLDFAADPNQAREHVNAWVSEATRGHIQDLLSERGVKPDTRLILANAIYFEARWARGFDPKLTRDREFYVDADTTVTVPMMWQREDEFRTAGNDWVTALELVYRDDEIAMLVVLPREEIALETVEDMLSLEMVNELVDSLSVSETEVAIPKLEIAYELPLKKTIIAMGMTNAFSEGADFSNIADEALMLSHAAHKAFIQIDEQGTKAAAATSVGGGPLSAPPVFIANRPFLFLIRDRLTGSILFLGRVTNPAG